MDKLHKYAQSYCEEVKKSPCGNSYYYHFNRSKFILRISDHIGKNSDGKLSIIIDEKGYLLHNHTTGSIYIESYENIKELIKSLATLNRISVHFDMNRGEIGDLKSENNNLRQQVESLTKKNSKLDEKYKNKIDENISFRSQLKAIKNDFEKLETEMRSNPFRTWFKLFINHWKEKDKKSEI